MLIFFFSLLVCIVRARYVVVNFKCARRLEKMKKKKNPVVIILIKLNKFIRKFDSVVLYGRYKRYFNL